jgi:hypothetical protein
LKKFNIIICNAAWKNNEGLLLCAFIKKVCMKYTLKAEELLMFASSLYGISLLDLSLSWWLYLLLFFAPDLGMIGYVVNTKIGSITYNLLHHKGIAAALTVAGMISGNAFLTFAGLIMFGHSSFDRIMGYGLKFPDSFGHTHLGEIGAGK